MKKQYVVRELKTKDEYILDQTQWHVNLAQNEAIDGYVYTLHVGNQHKKGNLLIEKIASDNKSIKLKGVEFELYKINNGNREYVDKYSTDSNGKIQINGLNVGNYILKEVSTDKWYYLGGDTEIEVKWSKEFGDTKVTIENEKKKGTIKVIKEDEDNNEIKLENVKFNIYDEDNKYIETITTNKEGTAESSKLRIDKKYFLVETETKEKYILDDSIHEINFTEKLSDKDIKNIKSDIVFTLSLTNKKKPENGQIRVIKIDKDNKKITIPGVEFEVLNSNMDIIETLTTDENGEAISKKIPITGEKYFVREKTTHEIYVLSDEVKEVELKENQITDITFENEKKKGTISIIKADKFNEDIKLQGAVFGIYNEDEELVSTIITDENGEGTSEKLVFGTYYIKELDTGSPYYLLDDEIYKTEITEDRENMLVELYNERTDIDVTVEKKRKCRD